MRILFVGAVEFSRHCLVHLLDKGADICKVFTLAPDCQHNNSDYVDLGPIAETRGVSVMRIRRIGEPDVIDAITRIKPDIIFVFGFSQLIPPDILSIPPRGCIGTHPALLPKDRGRHPLIWPVIEGRSESGLTFFYLDEGADSGDILWQRPFAIDFEDDAKSLYGKISQLATEAIDEFLPLLDIGNAPRIPQDHSQATYLRKRGEADGLIDWSSSALQIYNLVRALTHPYVGAHTYVNGDRVVVWKVRLISNAPIGEESKENMGQVTYQTDGELYVQSGDGILCVTDWETKPTTQIKVGDYFRNCK